MTVRTILITLILTAAVAASLPGEDLVAEATVLIHMDSAPESWFAPDAELIPEPVREPDPEPAPPPPPTSTVNLRTRGTARYWRTSAAHTDLFRPAIPYVHDGIINLFPGELIYIQVQPTQRPMIRMQLVAAPTAENRAMTASLTQSHLGTVLTIVNPFDRPLEFQAALRNFNENHFLKAGASRVQPGEKVEMRLPASAFQVIVSELYLR